MDLSEFEYRPENLPKDKTENLKFMANLREKWKAEIVQDEELKNYMNKFQGGDIESFAKTIVDRKMRLLKDLDWLIRRHEYAPEIKHRKEAEKAIELIQQKKLFNIQCLWRANQFEHPLLRCTYDFHFWEEHVNDCPFLDPASVEDIQLMQAYLRKPELEYTPRYLWVDYQDYHELLKMEDDHYVNMPPWYEYYDQYRNTGNLLKLPDLRSKHERMLMAAVRKEEAKKEKEKEKENPKPLVVLDKRKYFDNHNEIEKYFKTFEKDKHFMEINREHKIYMKEVKEKNDDDLDMAIYTLRQAKEPIEMVGGKDWKEAIKETAQRYKNLMVADDLDLLQEANALFTELGISTAKEDLTEQLNEHGGFMVKRLKQGALLLGIEPDKYW
jgi:hypothetical protein